MTPAGQFRNSGPVLNQKHSSASLFNTNFTKYKLPESNSMKERHHHIDYSAQSSRSSSNESLATASKLHRHQRKLKQFSKKFSRSNNKRLIHKTESQINSNVVNWLERNDKEKNIFIDYEAMEKGNCNARFPRKKTSLTKINRRRSSESLSKMSGKSGVKNGDRPENGTLIGNS